ncbi:hypothetical protein [uncultured Microbacterium sp.]|uniref:hypothetical protein n=1 Tax=uncultured Microbacterium sp. TaxID=191216 RepID=UPI0025DE73AE|nr:hypothetical protein [uncultured Microbacterium sp.]
MTAPETTSRGSTGPTPRSAVHFGVNVRAGSKHGLRISRDTYARINKRSSIYWSREDNPTLWDAVDENYEDAEHRILTDKWCQQHQAKALENFDLNMAYFAALDSDEFNQAIESAVASQRGMVEVTDLNKWDGVSGLYVMVLDGYRQAYIGIASGMGGVKERIRQHWSRSKEFDRLLWGGVQESILSVDSFRALDTTRIYAAKARDPLSLEHKVIEAFPSKFLLNRLMGGDVRLLGLVSLLGVEVKKFRGLSTDGESG